MKKRSAEGEEEGHALDESSWATPLDPMTKALVKEALSDDREETKVAPK